MNKREFLADVLLELRQGVGINLMESKDTKISNTSINPVNFVSQTRLNNHSLNIYSQFTFIIPASIMTHLLFLTGLSASGFHILSYPSQKNFLNIKIVSCAALLFQNLSVTTHCSYNNIQTPHPDFLCLSKFASLT